MLKHLKPALLMLAVMTILTGLVYPLAVTGIAIVVFPHQARGSVHLVDGKARGSELIGQTFDTPQYFWSRPSATAPAYNAAASSGSNLGPLNPAWLEGVAARHKALSGDTPSAKVPVDLVTASGSGLDPHISPASAEFQVERVAKARGVPADQVRELVRTHTEPRQLGILGEPRVNVLLLNLALDAM
jgi:K+-transporting ATPase ATPase C chain